MTTDRRLRLGAVLAVIFGAAGGAGLVAQQAPPVEPPPIRPWRYDEDYSYLRDPNNRTGAWWEPLKAIPLDEDGTSWLDFGGELRGRFESFENNLWGDTPVPDHDYFWFRAFGYADLHVGESFRTFVEFATALEFDDEAGQSPVDENRADLKQAFFEFTADDTAAGDVTARVGRQVLAYGSERLISTRYGLNVIRTFDAANVRIARDGWHVDLTYGRPVDSEPGAFDDEASDGEEFWTAYLTFDLPSDDGGRGGGLDVYYIGHVDDERQFNQGLGRQERHTVGVRVFGESVSGWDWNAEAFAQFGRFDGADILAWSVATDTGYTFRDAPCTPRIGFKANIISGDDDPNDGDLGTFDALYPKGRYFGEIALLGPSNLINLHPSVDLALTPEWSVGVAGVAYWRESLRDGIYSPASMLLRGDGGSRERFIGTQLDLTVAYRFDRTFDVSASYSAFLSGAFLEDTGPDDDVQFVAVEARVVF